MPQYSSRVTALSFREAGLPPDPAGIGRTDTDPKLTTP
jgi:hypothetical protein